RRAARTVLCVHVCQCGWLSAADDKGGGMRRNGVASGNMKRLWLAIAVVGAVITSLLQAPASVYAATNPVRPATAQGPAPVKLPASSGEPAARQPKQPVVGEQPERRTRFSSTRYNADHTFTTTTSVHPLNYRSPGG